MLYIHIYCQECNKNIFKHLELTRPMTAEYSRPVGRLRQHWGQQFQRFCKEARPTIDGGRSTSTGQGRLKEPNGSNRSPTSIGQGEKDDDKLPHRRL